MRKKTFLKMVSLFACFSILMLSVPGVIAADKAPKKFSLNRMLEKSTYKVAFLFSFLNLKVNKNNNSQTSDDNSGQKIKAAGTLNSHHLSKDD